MQTDTGKTPSEWIAIHAEEINRLARYEALTTLEEKYTPGVRAWRARVIEHGAAIRYWEAVRDRVIGGRREPLPWEARRRAEWRRAAAVARDEEARADAEAAEAYLDHMADVTGGAR